MNWKWVWAALYFVNIFSIAAVLLGLSDKSTFWLGVNFLGALFSAWEFNRLRLQRAR